MKDLYGESYFQGGHGGGVGYEDYLTNGHWFSYQVYDEIRPKLVEAFPNRGSFLDVGCAAGFLVEAAERDGWKAIGIDIASAMVKAGRAKGLDLRIGALEEGGFQDSTFDVVSVIHTLEHLASPKALMSEVRRVSTPRAMLVIEVPNIRSVGYIVRRKEWSQFKPPEHLNYFSRRSLSELLRGTGWRPWSWETNYLAEVSSVALKGEGGAGRFLGMAVSAARRLGAVEIIEKLGLGANLRSFSRPA